MDKFKLKSVYIYQPSSPSQYISLSSFSDKFISLYHFPTTINNLSVNDTIDYFRNCLRLSAYFDGSEKCFNLSLISNMYYITHTFEGRFITVSLYKDSVNKEDLRFNTNIDALKLLFKKLIEHFYFSLVLFNNNLDSIFANNPIKENDRQTLDEFITSYFELINERKLWILEFMQYFPISDIEFTNLIGSLQCLYDKFPEIKYSSILFKGHVLHNEIPLEILSILYNTFYSLTNINHLYSVKSLITNDKIVNNLSSIVIKSLYIKFKNTFEEYKFLPFYFEGYILFLFLDSKISTNNLFKKLLKLEKWVFKYFKNNIERISSQKYVMKDTLNYFYLNKSNKSIKISSYFLLNDKLIDEDKYEKISFLLNNCLSGKWTSLTNYKQNLCYFNASFERNFILIMNQNCASYNKEIVDSKNHLFEKIFIL